MTKEEKIKEAWKKFPMVNHDSINGFAITYCINGVTDILDDPYEKIEWECLEADLIKWRPLSLKGIEDNNGWSKIESEADLPKETNTYHFISRHTGKMMKDYFTYDSKVSGHKNCFFKLYSHYQPIKDPKLPIH
jgi:hypothetical protein